MEIGAGAVRSSRARDRGQALGEFAGANLEGPGGDVRREVQEAPVAEAQQVLGDLPYAVARCRG